VFKRQTTGSVICTSCGTLVGVNDAVCYNCNRRNPGLWGFAPAFRRLGQDLGFVPLVMGGTIALYVLSLLVDLAGMRPILAPSSMAIRLLGASGAYPVFVEGRWWTVLTAGWLHAASPHVLNMLWIRQLAPAGRALRAGPHHRLHDRRRDGLHLHVGGRLHWPGSSATSRSSAPAGGACCRWAPRAIRPARALVYYGQRTGAATSARRASIRLDGPRPLRRRDNRRTWWIPSAATCRPAARSPKPERITWRRPWPAWASP
jgi:hypothetical protein